MNVHNLTCLRSSPVATVMPHIPAGRQKQLPPLDTRTEVAFELVADGHQISPQRKHALCTLYYARHPAISAGRHTEIIDDIIDRKSPTTVASGFDNAVYHTDMADDLRTIVVDYAVTDSAYVRTDHAHSPIRLPLGLSGHAENHTARPIGMMPAAGLLICSGDKEHGLSDTKVKTAME